MNTKDAVERAAANMGMYGMPFLPATAMTHLHMYEYRMTDQYLFRGCITCGEPSCLS